MRAFSYRSANAHTCNLIERTDRLAGARACRRKFLRIFPGGFMDETYLAWERNYKWDAHKQWLETLSRQEIEALLSRRRYAEIAARAIRIESRTNLLFSFEKMALRDAVRTPSGANAFALGLHDFLFGEDPAGERFERWCAVILRLPRRQTRVLTWPVVTVFGFLAQPARHFFVKPMVCRRAAANYGYPLEYQSSPDWAAYSQYLKFARIVRRDLEDLAPRDMIDIQSFLWIQGSDEYA
jgi:hypothetical protein